MCSDMRALNPALAVALLGGGDGAMVTQPAIHGWSTSRIGRRIAPRLKIPPAHEKNGETSEGVKEI
jgi:hypothetical protein